MTHDNPAYVTLRQQVAGLLNPHCPAMNNSLECADCLAKAEAAIAALDEQLPATNRAQGIGKYRAQVLTLVRGEADA